MSEIRKVALTTGPPGRKEKEPPAPFVRLNVELGASNEDQYPEISYRDLISAHLKGEQSDYGKKKHNRTIDVFADIGAGYDENDSFIDNTDGYDEMCPPNYDTLHGGFYINCGSLEFKNVQRDDEDSGPMVGHAHNKRRISSSTESELSMKSSESSCKERALNSDDDDEKERRKNKVEGKSKSKKIRTEPSSAATSGKHTSDDNAASADSRTSHTEDSLTSKPAPSSENPITSDSSRDLIEQHKLPEQPKPETEQESSLPLCVSTVLQELASTVSRLRRQGNVDVWQSSQHYILRLEQALEGSSADMRIRASAWVCASKLVGVSRCKLLEYARQMNSNKNAGNTSIKVSDSKKHTSTKIKDPGKEHKDHKHKDSSHKSVSKDSNKSSHSKDTNHNNSQAKDISQKNPPAREISHKSGPSKDVSQKSMPTKDVSQKTQTNEHKNTQASKSKTEERPIEEKDLSPEEKERQIAIILEKIKAIIDSMKPSMLKSYKEECLRIQEENKKIALSNAHLEGGARLQERRLPKRRYPWCARVRQLLAGAARLAGDERAAAGVLAARVLPMFPPGFVRLPTLLRQASLSKDLKIADLKKQRIPIAGHVVDDSYVARPVSSVSLPINPSVNHKPRDKTEAVNHVNDVKINGMQSKSNSDNPSLLAFNSVFNSFSLAAGTDLLKGKCEQDHKNAVTIQKVDNKITDKHKSESEKYLPPSSIGSITITPVSQPQKFDPRYQASKLANNTVTVTSKTQADSKIRVKSPAEIMKAANIVDNKKEKASHPSTTHTANLFPPDLIVRETKGPSSSKEKQQDRNNPIKSHDPLRVDTNHRRPEVIKMHSPRHNGEKTDLQNQISKSNSPVKSQNQNSPTFAKPADKKIEKRNSTHIERFDVLQVDDSSSDVELIEDCVKSDNENDKLINTVITSTPKSKQFGGESSKDTHEYRHKEHKAHKREHSGDSNGPAEKLQKTDEIKTSQKDISTERTEFPHIVQNRQEQKEIREERRDLEKKDNICESQADIEKVLQDLRDLQNSQEQHYNSDSGKL